MSIIVKLLILLMALCQIALLCLAVYVIVQIVQDPASIGHFVGAVVKGFKEAL